MVGAGRPCQAAVDGPQVVVDVLMSPYVLLGEWLRAAVWLVASGMVACGALWCGVYGVQQATSGTAHERLRQCCRNRQIRREARRGIVALEAYLTTGLGPRADSGSG
jgi:hypothetical protein